MSGLLNSSFPSQNHQLGTEHALHTPPSSSSGLLRIPPALCVQFEGLRSRSRGTHRQWGRLVLGSQQLVVETQGGRGLPSPAVQAKQLDCSRTSAPRLQRGACAPGVSK